ncbi:MULTISPECIES: Rid family hydrolase [Comamonas]|jgi:2-iminobutanoate/2-iminopropanoate deaminase|uniref:RidA family protein n=1 Tax=Comamonas avium TaxID=2762231 RepID=A0ABR8S8H2_9BURK|nr:MULTISPECIES: Rid family hydrolase [Comamonas]MBD7959781.1 RidA family protein [Comamonas avium]MBD9403532.1 RidA family protein [Comamonas sp. CMM02]
MHKRINPDFLFNSTQYGFSQAVVSTGKNHIFLSGQVAANSDQSLHSTGMYEQATQCLKSIEKLLAQVPASLSDVTMLRLYIRADASNQQSQNDISRALLDAFGEALPASSWVLVSGLAVSDWLIEIEAQAVTG